MVENTQVYKYIAKFDTFIINKTYYKTFATFSNNDYFVLFFSLV